MLDILSFIDSPSIREYNRNTMFTPAEQAILICHSRSSSIENKLAALQDLVDNYQEKEFQTQSIAENRLADTLEPLHFRGSVEKQIEIWRQMLEDRYDNTGVVYAASLIEQGFELHSGKYWFYSDYRKAFAHLQREKQEYLDDEDLRDVKTFGIIRRIVLDKDGGGFVEPEDCYFFDNTLSLNMLWENPDRRKGMPGELCDIRDECYMHVPLPFCSGDLVKSVSPFWEETYYGVFAVPAKTKSEDNILQTGCGDASDMLVSIDIYIPGRKRYSFTDDTDILSLTACELEELPKKERDALVNLSKVRQGKMDLGALFSLSEYL